MPRAGLRRLPATLVGTGMTEQLDEMGERLDEITEQLAEIKAGMRLYELIMRELLRYARRAVGEEPSPD